MLGSIPVSGYMLASWFAASKVTNQSSANSPIPSMMPRHLFSHRYLSASHPSNTCVQLFDHISLSPAI
ncbi:hypothetical protein Lalb_Chr10g0093991 [Lupinus albus]|uniref:Uncharacterized protein n=1 Tax=Lupinus albus TaxID=3870 RepID=A0A6A4PUR9_LUPAL|nr:hypothetical protein Lalb_Chr10g0093991 [Lupinus albus]